MQIYAKEGLPLKICSPIGDLGNLTLYIKSKDDINKNDNKKTLSTREIESSDDESE